MADAQVALFELRKILPVKKEVTLEEKKILDAWMLENIRDFSVGALLGAGFGWITLYLGAPWRFSELLRIQVAALAAGNLGIWRFIRSTTSRVDHILALDGTLMQKELKNIMVTRLGNSTMTKQYLSRHFYLERVFDDSTSNQPKLRWRQRNFYSDGGAFDRRTNVNDSDSNLNGNSNFPATIQNDNDSTRTDLNSKQTFMRPAPDSTDPLDSIFGPMGGADEEIHHPIASKTPTKLHTYGRKISRRQRRMRHQIESANSNTSPAAG